MTRAVRGRILTDVNTDINDHLRNHVHLMNCIHLKNHMHSKHSPILSDRALVRDFIALQRLRSLRDPSPSPSWHSPSVVDMLLKRGDLASGRRSSASIRPHHRKRMSESSPQVAGLHASGSAIGEISRRNHGITSGVSERGGKDGSHEHRIAEKEESSKRFLEEGLVQESVSRSSELGNKSLNNKGEYGKDSQLRNISDRLKDVIDESDDAAAFFHNHRNGKIEKVSNDRGANVRGRENRAKRRKFRGTRRSRASIASVAAETENEISVASNSYAKSRSNQKFRVDRPTHNEHIGDHKFADVPRNGCGIPLNWSRIHDRGKSLLDMAGRSLSCGLSESRLKRGGSTSKGREVLDMPVMSEEDSSISTRSEREVFPLLFDASGSQGSIGRASWLNNYSGELGIFADDLLKQEVDSDLASEDRSNERHRLQRHHQSLTQKYAPKTFRDVVGQSLVVQALSNAIAKRKIGLLYVFYGPRGTGKTSCARVFARALNCQSLEHPKPCEFCDSCVSLDMGKSQSVKELGPVSNTDFEAIIELLENMKTMKHQSHFRVLIFDECDVLSSETWSAILKFVDRAPRRVVFVLVCSSLDVLPHVIISRCQKFFFPKVKEADTIYALQWIASKEDIEIDKDALKLIASRSDGSLRDAEMTLEQLSLIGKRISVGLVQELVGLISDEKLIDLLDLALSADTTNTVKNLRDIMESGVEPLALMSQLATVITDILAGSYDFTKQMSQRKFFRHQSLSKEDMEKLRQALRALSEAEKQLRASSDRITWLTAALLQLAPDKQYVLPSSSTDTSFNNSPLGVLSNASLRERPRKSNVEMRSFEAGTSGNVNFQQNDKDKMNGIPGVSHMKIDDIWLELLEQLPTNSLKEFMYQEAKLVSVSYGAAPTVQLLFKSHQSKSKAEKFRLHILQAFESVLRSPVTIEIRCDSRKEVGTGPILLPAAHDPSDLENPVVVTHARNRLSSTSQEDDIRRKNQNRDNSSAGLVNIREIIELNDSPKERKAGRRKDENAGSRAISSDERKLSSILSLVRGKLSLAHVIQHSDRFSQHSGWSKNKAVSIAEKLEQENLRLEPRSRRLRCWNPPKFTRRKISRLKIRTKKPLMLLKFMSCGRCLSARSPRQR